MKEAIDRFMGNQAILEKMMRKFPDSLKPLLLMKVIQSKQQQTPTQSRASPPICHSHRFTLHIRKSLLCCVQVMQQKHGTSCCKHSLYSRTSLTSYKNHRHIGLLQKTVQEQVLHVFCLNRKAKCPYRDPLSYGMPSALGARDFFEVKASTTREIMYGSIL